MKVKSSSSKIDPSIVPKKKPSKKKRINVKARLFIRNVSCETTEKDVRHWFEKYGKIEQVILFKKPDGTSIGSGFVQFKTKKCASQAIKECNEMPFMEKEKIQVFWAEPKKKNAKTKTIEVTHITVQSSTVKTNQNDKDHNEKKQKNTKARLSISNISCETTEKDVRHWFEKYGEIEQVILFKKPDGTSIGSGFVQFKTKKCASQAIKECNEMPFMEKEKIQVVWAKPKKKNAKNKTIEVTPITVQSSTVKSNQNDKDHNEKDEKKEEDSDEEGQDEWGMLVEIGKGEKTFDLDVITGLGDKKTSIKEKNAWNSEKISDFICIRENQIWEQPNQAGDQFGKTEDYQVPPVTPKLACPRLMCEKVVENEIISKAGDESLKVNPISAALTNNSNNGVVQIGDQGDVVKESRKGKAATNNNPPSNKFPSVASVCADFGIQDVQVNSEVEDFLWKNYYQLYITLVEPFLKEANPNVSSQTLQRLLEAKWREFSARAACQQSEEISPGIRGDSSPNPTAVAEEDFKIKLEFNDDIQFVCQISYT